MKTVRTRRNDHLSTSRESQHSQVHHSAVDLVFAGGGEMGALMRTTDWEASPLGSVECWPQSLHTLVSVALNSQFPTAILWGSASFLLYNDAYIPMLAEKHPAALGKPVREVWPEIWSIIGPMLERVLTTGEATWSADLLLPLVHNGVAGVHYFTFSFSPIRDETGQVRGVFCPVTETTAHVEREQREHALRQEAEAARDHVGQILEHMGDRFVALDPAWRLTYVNTSGAALMEQRREDVLGKTFWDLFPATRGTIVETKFRWAMEERRTVEFETYYAPWARWIEAHVSPLQDGGIGVFFRDITARKQTEKDRLRLAAIVDFSDDAIISMSLDGIITSWNAAAERIFGYRAEEMIGQSILRLLPEERHAEEEMILARLRRGEHIDHFETVRRTKTGQLLDISVTVSPLRDEHGRIIGASKIARDITAQRHTEHALHTSEEKYRSLFSAIDEGFCIIERVEGAGDEPVEFRYVEANPAFAMQTGASDIIGKTIQQVFHREPQDWRDTYDAVLRTGKPRRFERLLVTQGRELELYAFRVEDATQRRVAVLFKDITERKRAEAERERLLTELQRVNTELQQFSYIVSHDLNEPLRTMRSFVQLLACRTEGRLDSEAAEDMAFISDAAQRMQQMLTDLLAYTRAGQTPEFTAVDCEAVLAHVVEALQLRLTECRAVLTHSPLPTVSGDATRIGQVFQNLLSNALKFTCPKTPPRIHLSAQRKGQRWQFAVQDNGIGIDPKHADRIFQVFQRLHSPSVYPGTGIGLALCKRIIEQHGGRIWVGSTPGHGSTFCFTLPAAQEEATTWSTQESEEVTRTFSGPDSFPLNK